MEKLWIALAMIACSVPQTRATAELPVSANALGWLSGRWAVEKGGAWTEEIWTSSRGGLMTGTSKSGKGDKASEYEFLRISPDERNVLTYWASPGGRPPVPFRLTASGAGMAVFENPDHDYPKIIRYRRDGNRLTATIAGAGGANPISWNYTRVAD